MSMTHTSIRELLDQNAITGSLVDASGVLYNDEGTITTAPDTIRALQSVGPVIVVTNNSYMFPDAIHGMLAHQDIHIPESHIFSSGFGLYMDPSIHEHIKDKAIFHFGNDRSLPYLEQAGYKTLVSSVEQAETVVLTSTLPGNDNTLIREQVIAEKQRRPELPIVCCNPDHYIRGENHTLFTVIGYEGHLIEQATGHPVHWIGKPERKFSMMLKQWLISTHHIHPNEGLHFFDDNIQNVCALQSDLGVSGCCITETGLFHFKNHGPNITPAPTTAPTHYVTKLVI